MNINNELAHCEAQLSTIRIVSNVTSVDSQSVIAGHSSNEEPSQMVASEQTKHDAAASSQPLLAEYKELVASLEKSNTELYTVNEQFSMKVVELENEKTSLLKELNRLQAELQELRGGAMSTVGDVQVLDGAGENVKMDNKDTVEEEQVDDNEEEESEEETEGEQEAEVTSVQQLEEPVGDKGQVQPEVIVTMNSR